MYATFRRPQYLDVLPVELLLIIFEQLGGPLDCYCLAVTSRRTWEVGAKEVQRQYLASMPCMIGHRIICVGENTAANDIPPGLVLTEAEKRELSVNLSDGKADEDRSGEEHHEPSAEPQFVSSLNDLVKARFYNSPRGPKRLRANLGHEVVQRFTEATDQQEKMDFDFVKTFGSLIAYTPHTLDDLVLRNLSRRQYVRRDAVKGLNRRIEDCERRVNLGMAVLARILWSSVPSNSVTGASVHRGAWAGDRFDIVTKSMHLKDETRGWYEWTDVSEAVMQELETLYQENGMLGMEREINDDDEGTDEMALWLAKIATF